VFRWWRKRTVYPHISGEFAEFRDIAVIVVRPLLDHEATDADAVLTTNGVSLLIYHDKEKARQSTGRMTVTRFMEGLKGNEKKT
jgi:hypothetical protein